MYSAAEAKEARAAARAREKAEADAKAAELAADFPDVLPIYEELNLARKDPMAYAYAHVAPLVQCFDGLVLKAPGMPEVTTTEGVAAVEDAVRALRSTNPAPPFERVSHGLCAAAADHAKDLGQSGAMSSTGSDKSDAFDRISRHGNWQKGAAENIAYGGGDVRAKVVQLIIDDGCPSRVHRKAIFNSRFTCLGAAEGPHPKFEAAGAKGVMVQTFAAVFSEKHVSMAEMAKALKAAGGGGGSRVLEEAAKPRDPREKVELAFDVSERRILRKHLDANDEPNDPNAPQPTVTERSAVQIRGDKIVESSTQKVVAEVLSKVVSKTDKKKTTTTTMLITQPDGSKQRMVETRVTHYKPKNFKKQEKPDAISEEQPHEEEQEEELNLETNDDGDELNLEDNDELTIEDNDDLDAIDAARNLS